MLPTIIYVTIKRLRKEMNAYEDELIVSAFVPKICEQKFCFNAELSEKKAYEFNGFNIGGYSVIWSPLSSFGGLSVA